MQYKEILEIAKEVKEGLSWYCKRVEIAGSIRRKKKECNDIEIVAIPDCSKAFSLKRVLDKYLHIKGNFPGKYLRLQRKDNGVFIDLFFCNKENWWVIFVIRTGNADFSHFLVTRARKLRYRVDKGFIFDENGIPFEIESEKEVFDILKMKWIPPEKRNLTFGGYYEFTKKQIRKIGDTS